MSFPDVPPAPGVPPLPRDPTAAPAVAPVPLTSDSAAVNTVANGQNWGVFDSTGNPVINADSFVTIEYDKERRLSDYLQEEGAFATYNKVARPYDARVIFAKGGDVADRTAFLNELESVVDDTNLYTLVTPEVTYQNANMERYNYARKAEKGVTLIMAECFFLEIRITGGSQFTQTATPDGANPVSGGTVQPQPPQIQQQPPPQWIT